MGQGRSGRRARRLVVVRLSKVPFDLIRRSRDCTMGESTFAHDGDEGVTTVLTPRSKDTTRTITGLPKHC